MGKKKSYLPLLLSLLTVLLMLRPTTSLATEGSKIIYYGLATCSDCQIVEKYLSGLNLGDKLIKKDITQSQVEGDFIQITDKYKVAQQVPLIIINNKALSGVNQIKANLEGEINLMDKATTTSDAPDPSLREVEQIETERYLALTIGTIILAGLVDGINPCAIAMLIFFMAFSQSIIEKKTDVLKVGISYILATFITYFLMGLGLLKFALNLTGLTKATLVIYILTSAMCLLLVILNLRDYRNIKLGRTDKSQNQLPLFIRQRIFDVIQRKLNTQALVVTSFLVGVLVSILEFACTGQVYLPTITFILSRGVAKATPYLYLTLYNVSFILPIMLVCLITYKTGDTEETSNIFSKYLKETKLVTSLVYIIFLIFIINRITQII